jgi:hypothetical protein
MDAWFVEWHPLSPERSALFTLDEWWRVCLVACMALLARRCRLRRTRALAQRLCQHP